MLWVRGPRAFRVCVLVPTKYNQRFVVCAFLLSFFSLQFNYVYLLFLGWSFCFLCVPSYVWLSFSVFFVLTNSVFVLAVSLYPSLSIPLFPSLFLSLFELFCSFLVIICIFFFLSFFFRVFNAILLLMMRTWFNGLCCTITTLISTLSQELNSRKKKFKLTHNHSFSLSCSRFHSRSSTLSLSRSHAELIHFAKLTIELSIFLSPISLENHQPYTFTIVID